MNIKEGDIIKLTNKKNIYEYKAIKMMKVKDDRVDLIGGWPLGQYDGKAIISLMTCYYDEAGYRYLVNREALIGYILIQRKRCLRV